jgi:UMF1 family MFS transporter
MEFATIFTNAMLPSLGTERDVGRISGTGWAFGYLGGLVALVVMLLFFAESGGGTTLIGQPPALGLDPEAREGTRFVGPFTALWFIVFMIPFFLWVREPAARAALPLGAAARAAWPELKQTVRGLPKRPSLFSYLGASMLYRDALNGFYVFGGIYAAGVLGWSVIDLGVFGILAVITAAIFAWIGGWADSRFGPKPVIVTCVLILTALAIAIVGISREALMGVPVPEGSALPDIAFYVVGAGIGAAGGALQSASRSMMCRQAPAEQITEAFGLYALAGKATAFAAPLLIGVATDITGSQQAGISPLIALFLLSLVLLVWTKPNGAPDEWPIPPVPDPAPAGSRQPF